MTECVFVPDGKMQTCINCNKQAAAVGPFHRKCDMNAADGLSALIRRRAFGISSECRYLGAEVGSREEKCCDGSLSKIPIFSCGHPKHEQTTVAECLRCPDRLPNRLECVQMLLKCRWGLGDHIQLGIVLRHLGALHEGLAIDLECTPAFAETLKAAGLCHAAYTLGKPNPRSYDFVVDAEFREPTSLYKDCPTTKAERCLKEVFGIQPRLELCGYKCGVHSADVARMRALTVGEPFVVLHYQGNSYAEQKNPPEQRIQQIVRELNCRGRKVCVIDFDHRSGLTHELNVERLDKDSPIWDGNPDSAAMAALASLAELCIGIDSGPGKIMGGVDTPAIMIWTGFHPLQFYGLSPNVLHLVPEGHEKLLMGTAAERAGGLGFFEGHYNYEVYTDLTKAMVKAIDKRLDPEYRVSSGAAPDELVERNGWWVRAHNVWGDEAIIHQVHDEDEYKIGWLPELPDNALIVDVGAHIGSFARLVHERWPKAQIVCVEPIEQNAKLLRKNVGHFAYVAEAACTYEQTSQLWSCIEPGYISSTGGSMLLSPGQVPEQLGYRYHLDKPPVRITLEEILKQVGRTRIDLLKLDCEESEFSILENAELDNIDLIVGEFHGRERWDKMRHEKFRYRWSYKPLFQDESGYCGRFHYHHRKVMRRVPYRAGMPWIAVAGGIGDSVWALTKIPALLREYGAEQCVIGVQGGGPPFRAQPFLNRFDFVHSCHYDEHTSITRGIYKSGVFDYEPSVANWRNTYDWLLVANGHLEEGKRLENWQPQLAIDWSIGKRFHIRADELLRAEKLRRKLGPFVCFYLGPLAGNAARTSGHNRGELWTPSDWGRLAAMFRQAGRKVVLIGADYDRPYLDCCKQQLGPIIDRVGAWHIAETFATVKQADALIAFQSGLAVMGVYLGVPTCSWWRPHGNSLHPEKFISFDENMAWAWAPKEAIESGWYLPQIYGRSTPEGIFEHAQQTWLE